MITTRAVRHNLERNPLKDNPRFGVMWFSDFRGKDLNVKAYDVQGTDGWAKERTTMNAKWLEKLTWPLARWHENRGRYQVGCTMNLHFNLQFMDIGEWKLWITRCYMLLDPPIYRFPFVSKLKTDCDKVYFKTRFLV